MRLTIQNTTYLQVLNLLVVQTLAVLELHLYVFIVTRYYYANTSTNTL